MTNAVIAERSPDTVKVIADRGHEVLSHSYAMDVIPALLSDDEERKKAKPLHDYIRPRRSVT
jgi:peptidoglycan/xylan/chitin deacetylase (PgdA/CDA1 family)